MRVGKLMTELEIYMKKAVIVSWRYYFEIYQTAPKGCALYGKLWIKSALELT